MLRFKVLNAPLIRLILPVPGKSWLTLQSGDAL